MFQKAIILCITFFICSCATAPSPQQQFLDSLLTDGTYVTTKQSADGDKGYIRFYISSAGKKYFKTAEMADFSKENFEKVASEVNIFSVNPQSKELNYSISRGAVRARVSTNMNNFIFLPDNK